MEPFIYLLKSAAILTLFYFVYLIVLQKDTFFTSNRHYLIGGIITSLLLPFVIFTKTIYIDIPVISSLQNYNNVMVGNSSETIQLVSFNWELLLIFIYSIGILFMSFRFIYQLFSLYRIIQKNPSSKKNGFYYVKVGEDISPFSFFKYIVYNPEKHSEADLKMILKHEQAHASQLHSIDIILSNLLLIVQWMNPFAWLYKKGIEENLEFLADNETIQKVSSKTAYQITMLKSVTSETLQPLLANNFYQSIIKKRIIMLQKNQSATKNQWKLLLILPFLGLFLWSFNVEEVVKYNDYATAESASDFSPEISSIKNEVVTIPEVSEKKAIIKTAKNSNLKSVIVSEKKNFDNNISVSINKNTSDAELENLKKLFNDNYGVSLKFSGVKRNSAGEIKAIKVKMKSENSNASYNVSEDDNISEFTISYDKKTDSISIGSKNRHNSHGSSKASSGYTYEIINDNNGKVNTWVSSDTPHAEKGKNNHVIHTNGDSSHEIHVISENGNSSTVWVSKDGKVSKNTSHSIFVERDEDSNGEENIFIIRSGDDDGDALFIETDDDSDSIFVKSDGKSGIFISDTGSDSMLIFINGEKSTKEAMDKLAPGEIKNIEVLKGDGAVKKYGKKAKDGVILITTKN